MLAIFLDLETTGLDPALHAVVEVAFKVLDVATQQEVVAYETIVKQPQEIWDRRDPLSVQINGFSWEQLLKGKEPITIGEEVKNLFQHLGIRRGKAVYICQNPAFDRSFFAQLVSVYKQQELTWPYHWLDLASMYWALLVRKTLERGDVFPYELNLSKNSIAEHYHIPPESHPHRAMNGVDHLIGCYKAVMGFGYQ